MTKSNRLGLLKMSIAGKYDVYIDFCPIGYGFYELFENRFYFPQVLPEPQFHVGDYLVVSTPADVELCGRLANQFLRFGKQNTLEQSKN